MIRWKDFILDDFLGPVQIFREERPGGSSVMDDADGTIQETRPAQQPARMVGSNSLDFNTLDGKEADRGYRVEPRNQREEG